MLQLILFRVVEYTVRKPMFVVQQIRKKPSRMSGKSKDLATAGSGHSDLEPTTDKQFKLYHAALKCQNCKIIYNLAKFRQFSMKLSISRKIHTNTIWQSKFSTYNPVKGVLHPRPVFGLFLHFSQKLQHIGNK